MVIFDIETDGLDNPTKIHCACVLDLTTNTEYKFFFAEDYNYTAFLDLLEDAIAKTKLVGHNIIKFDIPVINSLAPERKSLDLETLIMSGKIADTLVMSRLFDTLRISHSLEDYGKEFNLNKIEITNWTTATQEMLDRCVIDCRIVEKILQKFTKFLNSNRWAKSLEIETHTDFMCYLMEKSGFGFNEAEAIKLKQKIDSELSELLGVFRKIFPPKPAKIKLVTPRQTKSGAIALNSVPEKLRDLIEYMTPDASFSVFEWKEFNPQSAKDRIDRLWDLGWRPVNMTDGHKEFLKTYGKSDKNDTPEIRKKREHYKKYGWVTDEENLNTAPKNIKEIQYLKRWLFLTSMSNRLKEWLELSVNNSIHGKFFHIGSWTHRLSHSNPNMANIPSADRGTEFSETLRKLWVARPNKLLVGVDAESIQLRVLAHYIDDYEFTNAIVSGNKQDGTDIHTVMWKIMSPACKSRSAAKNFIYAWLLGAGYKKLSQVLDCTVKEAEQCEDKIMKRFKNLNTLHKEIIPNDAKRGWFIGLDGRGVRIPGESYEERRRLALAGYLQNGEAVIMKLAMQKWFAELRASGVVFSPVNFVHDEFQTETVDNKQLAEYIATVQTRALQKAGEELKLKCPIAGSMISKTGQLSIGYTWLETH